MAREDMPMAAVLTVTAFGLGVGGWMVGESLNDGPTKLADDRQEIVVDLEEQYCDVPGCAGLAITLGYCIFSGRR